VTVAATSVSESAVTGGGVGGGGFARSYGARAPVADVAADADAAADVDDVGVGSDAAVLLRVPYIVTVDAYEQVCASSSAYILYICPRY
jgi:hypothetical protein